MRISQSRLVAAGLAVAFFAPAAPAAAAAGQASPHDSQDGDWHYRVAPYLWATGLSGDIGLGEQAPVGSIDAEFSDVWDHLDIAGMLMFDAQRDRWGIAADFFYAKLSVDSDAYADAGYGTVDVDTKNKIVHLAATYRLSSTDAGHLDLIGGLRYSDVNTTLKVGAGPSLPDEARATDSQNWVDGFVGLRGDSRVSDRRGLFGQFDAGAGGTDL